MEGPPPQITPKDVDDYLEQLSKPVFQAGMSWRVIDAKWPTIKKAFYDFQTERVARFGDREIDKLAQDERVIRSRPKIAAIVHNANALLELERNGGIKKHFRSFDEYEALATDLKKRFKFVGDSGMYHFLWTVKQPVPEWREWAKSHGLSWGQKKPVGHARTSTATAKTRAMGAKTARSSSTRKKTMARRAARA